MHFNEDEKEWKNKSVPAKINSREVKKQNLKLALIKQTKYEWAPIGSTLKLMAVNEEKQKSNTL